MSVTGVLLNHKQPVGYMAKAPDVPKREAGFKPLPVAEMVESATEFRGLGRLGVDDVKSVDYRPKGYVKVRYKDHDREVIVDAADGSILKSSRRWDVWIEDLRTGVLFGANGWFSATSPPGSASCWPPTDAYAASSYSRRGCWRSLAPVAGYWPGRVTAVAFLMTLLHVTRRLL